MSFNDYEYQKINLEEFKQEAQRLIDAFIEAGSVKEQLEIFADFNKIRSKIDTASTLVRVRSSIDSADLFYDKEKQFFDENYPIIYSFIHKFYQAMVDSNFREQLEEELGEYLFKKIACDLKSFNDEIIAQFQRENELVTEYQKLMASANIAMGNKKNTLSKMRAYSQNKDRKIRKEACLKVSRFFDRHLTQFDDIFDQLVKVRTEKAQKLGFENYIEYGYISLGRTDYNASDVKKYRKQIQESIVPTVSKLKLRQAKRIGLPALKIYDQDFVFKTGNPTPKGDERWIVNNVQKMYQKLSPETASFFDFMKKNNLMDLVSREGKSVGAYCTFFADFKAPFIFTNFNGTANDVTSLIHETGHAFQVFQSRDFKIPEYIWPTYEACEIHSMSMEFLSWPWMDTFFEEDTKKFKFFAMNKALDLLPYATAVDEFQHWVYKNYKATPIERRQQWLVVSKKYMPYVDYDGISGLEKGAFWLGQHHIFTAPFYYIDYALAQICALQFWFKNQKNKKQTWADYLSLCKLGGSKPFLELVKSANLRSPFEEDAFSEIIFAVEKYLDSIDDSEL